MAAPPRRAPPPVDDEEAVEGASANERLLSAAKDDNEEMIQEALEDPGLDINHQDGLGNTALHYAISHASVHVLEHLLCAEGCDVDVQNGQVLDRDTPLHLAVKVDEEGREGLRAWLVEQLIEAGANPFIKNKHHLRPSDLLPPPPPPPRRGAPLPPPGEEDPEIASNEAVRSALRRGEAEFGLHGAGGGEGHGGDVADEDDMVDAGDIADDDD